MYTTPRVHSWQAGKLGIVLCYLFQILTVYKKNFACRHIMKAPHIVLSTLLASIASVRISGQTIVTFGDSLTDNGYGAKYVQKLLNTTEVSSLCILRLCTILFPEQEVVRLPASFSNVSLPSIPDSILQGMTPFMPSCRCTQPLLTMR